MVRKKRGYFTNLIFCKLPKYPSIVYIPCAKHMFDFFFKFNSNLDGGVPGVQLSPIGVNCSNRKFGGTLKNESKFRVVKCNCPQ